MIEETDFETFIYISKNKYQIFVFDKNNSKNLYNKEIKVNDEFKLENLSKFIDENIYKIEKAINSFIRNIILIVEDKKVLDIGISIKKKNYENNIDQKNLENSLIEVKDIFRENYQDQIIMHMIVVNNDNNEKFLLNNANKKNDYLYLEVNFISISSKFTYIFEKLLEDYQIKIEKYMSGSYIKSFFDENETDIALMANELNNGLNKNEVKLVTKDTKSKGFFERFFQLLS